MQTARPIDRGLQVAAPPRCPARQHLVESFQLQRKLLGILLLISLLILAPSSARSNSTRASAKSRFASSLSPEPAVFAPFASRHVFALSSLVGSQTGTFHGGAVTKFVSFVANSVKPCG